MAHELLVVACETRDQTLEHWNLDILALDHRGALADVLPSWHSLSLFSALPLSFSLLLLGFQLLFC